MFKISKDRKWFDRAVKCLELCYSESSISVLQPNGDLWIEEYPSKPSSYVLNGFIFFLIAQLEVEMFDRSVKNHSKDLICSFLNNFHQYQLNSNLLYCLRFKKLASKEYLEIHNNQMEHLVQLTGFKEFRSCQM